MNTLSTSEPKSELNYLYWLKILLLITLILGIFLRFFNIDKKIYWNDESYTSVEIAGYTVAEVAEELSHKQVFSVQDLSKFQYPNSERNWTDTVKSLSFDVHPPLYFVLLRWWTQIFGNSIAVIRSFSAVVSLLAFLCVYWLCLELFEYPFVGWLAIGLLAVSPFQVLYAQEARMYSLWTVTILLSSAALVRAMRLNTKFNWLIYSLTLVLIIYTHLFSLLVAVGHGVYISIIEKFRLTQKFVSYLTVSFLAFLIYLPWMIVLFINKNTFDTASSWLHNKDYNLVSILKILTNNITNYFVDFWFAYKYFPDLNFPNLRFGIFLKPLLIGLVLYSIYFLCRRTEKKVWLFVLTLSGTTPLLLILKDLLSGSITSAQARYVIPCYLGITISVAYLLSSKVREINLNYWQKKGWHFITVFLISLGLFSCLISSQAESWSNKYHSNEHQVAGVINQSANPLVISDAFPTLILSLSHQLNSQVKFQFLGTSEGTEKKTFNDPQIWKNFSNIFLFKPSEKILQDLAENKNYQAIPVKKINGLWQLEKINEKTHP